MSQISVQVPETLHHQLEAMARNEGVSLDQYVLYVLARQASFSYRVEAVSPEEQERQRESFAALRQQLGRASADEIERALAEREPVEPEPELTPEIIARVRERIEEQRKQF
jgi:hypothetical protein